jgi:hypothetical protein
VAALTVQPLRAEFPDGHLADRWRDVLTASLRLGPNMALTGENGLSTTAATVFAHRIMLERKRIER